MSQNTNVPAMVVGTARFGEDGAPTASQFNALIDALDKLQSAPSLLVSRTDYVIKLTASDGHGKYAWREQLGGPPQEWIDGPARGSLEDGDWPAYEINGNGTLDVGTIVLAHRTAVGDLRFQHGGCN